MGSFKFALRTSAAATVFLLPNGISAQTVTQLPPVLVEATSDAPQSGAVERNQVGAQSILGASDTANLLKSIPGTATATGGGISSLPIIHGLADDRIRTLVDGVPVSSSCPNHMNPALSYVAPSFVDHVSVLAGITPVSAGGDSIGGTISVAPVPTLYADPGQAFSAHGSATTYFRSNDQRFGLNGDVNAATQDVSLHYNGSWTRAGDARDGNGNKILASEFQTQSHNAALSARKDEAEIVVRAGHQLTPYEGFPNALMDLLGNTSNYLNASYTNTFGWGRLESKVYWQNAKHFMDFLGNERNNPTGHMPMNTDGTDAGYSLKAEIPLTKDDTLRTGNEYHINRLNDWWPPVAGSMMMGPNTFVSLNNGRRDQLGTFAEWERKWDPQWTSLIGLRNDTIFMNTGNVSGYGSSYASDAAVFNRQDHHKTDVNFDVTATARYDATATNTEEFGIARKTRSPNLYERYAWSQNNMASSMIGWLGNGNYYVGDVNLRPETANTISSTFGWHDAARQDWDIKLTPYYTYVQDYIGVDNVQKMAIGRYKLRFANHDAQLFGFDLAGKKTLFKDDTYGAVDLAGSAGWVRGMQVNDGSRLYRMQPLNALISLNHRLDGWSSTAELKLVNDKSVTNPLENEHTTPGFAIVNLRTSYTLENVTVSVGADNLFNKQYYDPNGGAYISYWRATNTSAPMGALPAPGRSFNAGLTVAF